MSKFCSGKHWIVVFGLGAAAACTPESTAGFRGPDASVAPPTHDPSANPVAGTSAPVPVGGVGGVLPVPSDVCSGGVGGAFGGAAPSVPAFSGTVAPKPLQRATVTAQTPPPPISGGTLLATKDGKLLVASDPDRDQLYFVDSATYSLLHVRKLNSGDEPGRLVEDDAGRIHVALRGGHAIASLTRDAESAIARREVCDLPRGMAYDAKRGLLQIACAEGKLVSLAPEADGAVQRTLDIGRDARDVIARGDELFVTHFRSAELQRMSADGTLQERVAPPSFKQTREKFIPSQTCGGGVMFMQETSDDVPTVAWRAIDVPGHGVTMLHQRARTDEIQVSSGGYGSGTCAPGIVQTSITSGMGTDKTVSLDLADAALAVDLATDPDGVLLAVVSPGNWGDGTQVSLHSLATSPIFNPAANQPFAGNSGGGFSQAGAGGAFARIAMPSPGLANACEGSDRSVAQPEGQATAVAFASPYMLAVQEREPAGISFIDTRTGALRSHLDLKQASRFDTGHSMFHVRAGAGIACASCHAEAGDDAHVWSFHGIGARRTQTLRGGILGTEPFHWNGDMDDFPTLVKEVFVGRMAGFAPATDQTNALAQWIDKQPALHGMAADPGAVQRGKQLFESQTVGCASCHAGEHFTDNRMAEVGTGAMLQVPSLRGVSFRTPLMHNGCAANLAERFTECGGGDKHGHTSQLMAGEIKDLIAYLETL